MITYKTNLFMIRCLTNMHVGSGANNYGVIDNLVQRDSITNYPCINASSLKGALRAYFTQEVEAATDAFISYVFGSEPSGGDAKEMESGAYRFLSGDLLTLPVRSVGGKPFYRTYSSRIIEDLIDKCKMLNCALDASLRADLVQLKLSGNQIKLFSTETNVRLEDYPTSQAEDSDIRASLNPLAFWGNDLAFCPAVNIFEDFVTNLPVMARNQLEDGISQNLWYEEVVPRETRFYCFISIPYKDSTAENPTFETSFMDNLYEKVVQIGANASIGQGYCRFTKIG